MQESKFGAPAGFNYVGKFLGLKSLPEDTARVGRDGKPMPPGVEWQFEITQDPDHSGEFVGKIVGRITSPDPTTRNACGTLLSGLVGVSIPEMLSSRLDYNPGDYVGQSYQLVISRQKDNPERTQVTEVKRANGSLPLSVPGQAPPVSLPQTARSQAALPAVLAGRKPAPPPRPGGPVPPKQPQDEPRYWASIGGSEPEEVTGTEIREQLSAGKEVKVMSLDQSSGWQPPKHFGLDEPF